MGKWQVLRNITRKRSREPSDNSSDASEKPQSKVEAKTQIFHVPSPSPRNRTPPPRLELPIDFWSSPFSKATYSPPSSPEIPKLRRMKAMDDLSPPAFRLMDLPTELRLHIVGFYFGQKTMAVSLRGNKPDQKRFFCKAHKQRRLNIVALLQSCRRLSREAHAVLWHTTTFFISIGDSPCLRKQPRPAMPLSLMRHVVLTIGYVDETRPFDFRELLLSFQSLRTADVHFDFTDDNRFPLPTTGDWIVEEVAEVLKAEKFGKVSCVSHETRIEPSGGKLARRSVPYSCAALEELKAKSNALDVSHHECGEQKPKLTNGEITVWDTGLLMSEKLP